MHTQISGHHTTGRIALPDKASHAAYTFQIQFYELPKQSVKQCFAIIQDASALLL